ncbi:MAG: ice-binding family protein [Candidatus Aenigmatarchaeota archaeon]
MPPNAAAVIVPQNNTAVIVPVLDVTPNVPDVVFIGITTISPLDLAKFQGVSNNIVVTFDEAMDPATVNQDTFMVKGPNNASQKLNGQIASDAANKVWTFMPSNTLQSSSLYVVTVTTAAKGVSGNSLVRDFVWSFTTAPAPSSGGGGGGSSSSPAPAPAAAGAVLTKIILTPASTTLAVNSTQQLTAAGRDQFGAVIAATIAYNTSNITVANVSTSGLVTALVAGNATITATSGAISNTSKITVTSIGMGGPAAVNLSTAGNFAILTKAGITDTGSQSSVITGDIGNSPITYTGLGGVWCSEITGKIYGVDAAYVGNGDITCFMQGTTGGTPNANKTYVDNAVGYMGTAYTDASSRVNGTGLPDYLNEGTGILDGLTLYPGIHNWGTAVTISTVATTGSVTLDCQGNASAVFIMQIAGTLNIGSQGTVADGDKVLLTNDCNASNIFWAVTGVTTLGTYSTFEGNILSAGTSTIALQTGAVLNGRALSDGAVTLDANPVTKPV